MRILFPLIAALFWFTGYAHAQPVSSGGGAGGGGLTVPAPITGSCGAGNLVYNNAGNTGCVAAAAGTGTVSVGALNQVAYYPGAAASVSGNAGLTINAGLLTVGQGGTSTGSLVFASSGGGTTTLHGPGGASANNIGIPAVGGADTVALLGFNQTFTGTETFSGALTFSGLTTGTQVSCLGLTAANAVVLSAAACGAGAGGVTTVSVVSANGFAGSVATATTTPAITISTSITGLLKGNGTAVAAAIAGTDYLVAPVANASLATQTANTVLGALTATTPSGLAVPSCSGATNALIWTTGTGFGCNTITGGAATSIAPGTTTITGVTAPCFIVNSATTVMACNAAGSGVITALGVALSAAGGVSSTIANNTATLGTSAIASGACATVVTVAGANIATTDVLWWGFNSDPTGVVGYQPVTTGALTIFAYPTSGNANFKVCNMTSASITPGAVTLNWRVVR